MFFIKKKNGLQNIETSHTFLFNCEFLITTEWGNLFLKLNPYIVYFEIFDKVSNLT